MNNTALRAKKAIVFISDAHESLLLQGRKIFFIF